MTKEYSKAEEKAMLKSKQLIKRYRFLTLIFTFLPFLLEDWLKEMHKKGYVLYKMKNKVLFFSFLFEKSNASVSYSVDVRCDVDNSYFEHHQQCGWQLMYTPVIKNSGYSVWMRVNEGTMNEAEFFSDTESKIAPTRKSLIIYFWGVVSFWLIAIIAIIIARVFELEKLTEYCYNYFAVSFFYTLPVPFVLSFYLYQRKKNGNTNITQRSLSKRLLLGNIATFFGILAVFIISTILTATTEILADGTTQITLLSSAPFIYSLQIALLLGIIAFFLTLFITIPYYIIQSIKNRK